MIPLPRLLDGSLAEIRRIRPVSVSITESITPLSTATMVVRADEEIAERSYVELFTVNGSAGVYRTKTPQTGYGAPTCTVTLEHALCEIGDWIVRADIAETEKSLSQALTQVFAYYGGNRWQLGSVITGDVIFSANYTNLLSCIVELVGKVPTAMISCDFTTSPWTLNVVSRGTSVAAEGRLSRNIRSVMIQKNDQDLCTRLYMEGLGAGGAVGHMDADTISTYGVIEKKVNGGGYTAAQAQIVAADYLDRHKRPAYTVTISGDDFSAVTGETLDRVAIGKLYRLSVPADGVTLAENITRIVWPNVYGTPEAVELTLAEEEATLITFMKKADQQIQGAYQFIENKTDEYEVRFEVNERSISSLVQKTGVNSLGQDETLYSRISQTESSITTEVSRASEAEGTLSSRITQTATSISSEVTRATEAEGTLSSRITQTATDITSVVTKTGINSLGQQETLYSKISQNATAITSEVTRATTAEGTLSSRITQTATDITSLVTKTGVNSLGQSETLYSKISQNATSISTEVTRATTAEGTLSSSISQNATDITALVTKTGVNSLGQSETLYSKISANTSSISAEVTRATSSENTLSGQITAQANKIALVVTESSGSNVINSAGIVAAINSAGSSVKINASAINLAGNVSITDLSEFNSTGGGSLDVQYTVNANQFNATTAITSGVRGSYESGAGWIEGKHIKAHDGLYLGSHYLHLEQIVIDDGDPQSTPTRYKVVCWT